MEGLSEAAHLIRPRKRKCLGAITQTYFAFGPRRPMASCLRMSSLIIPKGPTQGRGELAIDLFLNAVYDLAEYCVLLEQQV